MEIIALLIFGLFIVLIVLPIAAFARVSALQGKLDATARDVWDLRHIVNDLKERLDLVEPGQAAARSAPKTPVEPARPAEPARPIYDQLGPDDDLLQPSWLRQSDQAPPPPPAPPRLEPVSEPEPAPAPAPAGSRRDWEDLIGGNLFNRVGAIALLIGIGFLLKYGFDHNWITPWMLVAAGFACGLALIVAGDRFNVGGARVFAQGLIGAGVSVLYLSTYAAGSIYRLMPGTAALALMCVVTVVAFLQAVRADALVVALLGLVGGFLTPVLLGGQSGGASGGVSLFAYIALLDIGLLALTIRKDSWAVVEPLALIGTYTLYLGWNEQSYSPDKMAVVVGFLTVYWVLFHALDLYRCVKSVDTYPEMRAVVPVVSLMAYYAAIYAVIGQHDLNTMAIVSAGIGAVYLVSGIGMIRLGKDVMAVVPRFTVSAIVMLALATGLGFRDREYVMVSLWAVEALALVWCGLHWRMRYVWACALGLLALAVGRLLASDTAFGFREMGR